MANIPAVPRDLPVHQQQFLQALKKTIESKFPPDIAPKHPTNVTAHPLPGGVQITFTGGEGADKHLLLVSDQPTWDPTRADNHIIDLGQGTMHVHLVGQPAVNRYYWVKAVRGNASSSPATGPIQATTLALNVAAANSPFVPLKSNLARSAATGRATVLRPQKGGHRDLL